VIKQMVCEKRGIADGTPFAIYEMTPEGEERYLEPDERILDLVAYWQRLYEEEKAKGDDAAAAAKKKSKKWVCGAARRDAGRVAPQTLVAACRGWRVRMRLQAAAAVVGAAGADSGPVHVRTSAAASS
jgi:hypothetical protein